MPVLSIVVPFAGQRELKLALAHLTVINVYQLRWHPTMKPLYGSGVRYKREPRPREDWLSIMELYERGYGDCEDLACARAAELIMRGEHARAFASPSAHVGWHILVRRADGAIEDPSRILGMGGEVGRQKELRALRARGAAALRGEHR